MPQRFLLPKKAGFTLIELLVTVTLTSLILLAASTILTTFFLSNSRTVIRKQIKVEGNRALSRIEFVARGAKSCANSGSNVIITHLDDSTTTLRKTTNNITIQQGSGPQEELLSAFTLSSAATVLSCHTEGANNKQYIRASILIQNTDTSAATIDETFTSFTVLRNS